MKQMERRKQMNERTNTHTSHIETKQVFPKYSKLNWHEASTSEVILQVMAVVAVDGGGEKR
jgi:hypothetical protein